jgi:hypothetical protein
MAKFSSNHLSYGQNYVMIGEEMFQYTGKLLDETTWNLLGQATNATRSEVSAPSEYVSRMSEQFASADGSLLDEVVPAQNTLKGVEVDEVNLMTKTISEDKVGFQPLSEISTKLTRLGWVIDDFGLQPGSFNFFKSPITGTFGTTDVGYSAIFNAGYAIARYPYDWWESMQ